MTQTVNSEMSVKKVGLNLFFKTVLYAFAVFGLLFILILVGVLLIMGGKSAMPKLPERAVLNINFDNKYSEVRQDDFFAEFMEQSEYSIFDLERAIYSAAENPNVVAITASVNNTPLGLAQIEELGDAIRAFRAGGKKAYIFSNGVGAFGKGSKEYVLASYFDEIWMQPNSDIGLTGVSIEVPFFKKILDKIGVKPEFYTRYEYKTAMSSFLENGFTPAYKKEMSYLGQGLFRTMEMLIMLNRDLSTELVTQNFNNAPLFVEEAVKVGLVDKIAYRQDMYDYVENKFDGKIFSMKDYLKVYSDLVDENQPQIALLILEGVIDDGKSSNNPYEDAVIGAETVVAQLREIGEQPNLKALVLRVNSPGGSYTASDEILHAIENLKAEKNIPVIVSMGEYAASGGYFISLAGDAIWADQSTITGSIGVLGGKFVLTDLWKKIGVNWEELNYGQNAGILSMNHQFTPIEKKIFNRSLDRIYADFTQKVAKYRGIDMDKMDEVARGRVWLGSDAVDKHLVDNLGGVIEALLDAKNRAGIAANDRISLLYYPRRPSFQEKLENYLQGGGGLPSVRVVENIGLDMNDIRLLQRLQYNAILAPFKIEM